MLLGAGYAENSVSVAVRRSVWSCYFCQSGCVVPGLEPEVKNHRWHHLLHVWLEWPDCHDTGSLWQRQRQLQSLPARFSCLNLPVLPHSALVLTYLEDDNLLLPSVASYACMVVISAVEQIIPAWQITSLVNVRPYDQILGIFVCPENQKNI